MFVSVAHLLDIKLLLQTKIFVSQLLVLHFKPHHFLVTLSVKATHSRSVEIYEKAGDKYRDQKRCGKWQCSSDKTFTARPIHFKKTPDTTTYAGVAKTDSNSLIATVFLYYTFRFRRQSKIDICANKGHISDEHDAISVALTAKFDYTLRCTCETMIAFLSGKLLEKQANTAIVDVGGVGYEVSIPLSTFYELGDLGSDVNLRIYTHVREDAIQLFGFKTVRERDLYLRLISVQGIGPKMGITMLSGMSADEIILAIRTEDLARLTSIPGVGRKTAERLAIELRDKIGELSSGGTAASDVGSVSSLPADGVFEDALSALVNLGYQRLAAEKALKQAAQDGTEITVQKLLRKALQVLAK
jgi:Holliday junction DNA helicase RuvA